MGTGKITKKKKNQTPETQFYLDLNLCSKNKDLRGAISLYEAAVSHKTRLNQQHFNGLLYLCSNSVTDPLLKDLALEYGFRIFDHISSMGIPPNEATITAVARLAAVKGDGDYAFGLVKEMGKSNAALPRLRTYDPALYCFCEKLELEKACEVEQHMGLAGVSLEEPELAALLKVSVDMGREERVYQYLLKLRSSVRCVSESTAKIIEDWFCGKKASEVGELNWEVGQIKDAVYRNGGGWHGKGWIGRGNWIVSRGRVDSSGQCCSCNDKLFCVDIDDEVTERFAQSVASLAMEREVKSNFSEFQNWVDEHGDYEAIVDGANVGLYQQNFADGGFSVSQVVTLILDNQINLFVLCFFLILPLVIVSFKDSLSICFTIKQLDSVVKELYNRSGNKWPLVVLHNKRFRALMENPSHRNLVEEWRDKGILYTTPSGSNDDWYWLYATVKLKCLLVTNDEMRDHIFELLGSSFFLKWKERHQVKYTFVKGSLMLQMPPLYSSVIQESEKGTWHVPVAGDSSEESERTWLCITRPTVGKTFNEISQNGRASQNGGDDNNLKSCTSIAGKRKERSSSTSDL